MIDNLDKRIITILKKDSRCPFVEIADKLGVSEGTIRSRVHRMVDEGVICEEGTPDQILVNPQNERTKNFLFRFIVGESG